jgi:hypothetical protein
VTTKTPTSPRHPALATPAQHQSDEPGQKPEGQEPQKERHSDNGTQATTPNTVPLGTEWYADLSPKVKRYIEQKNPQNTRDLYAMLLEVVEHLETRVGVTS